MIAVTGVAVGIGILGAQAAEAATLPAAPSGPTVTVPAGLHILRVPTGDWPWHVAGPATVVGAATSVNGPITASVASRSIIPSCPLSDWPWLCH